MLWIQHAVINDAGSAGPALRGAAPLERLEALGSSDSTVSTRCPRTW